MNELAQHNCDRTHVHGVAFARCAFPGYRVTGEGVHAVVDHDARHVWCWASQYLASQSPGEQVRLRVRCSHPNRVRSLRGMHEVGWRCRDCGHLHYFADNAKGVTR